MKLGTALVFSRRRYGAGYDTRPRPPVGNNILGRKQYEETTTTISDDAVYGVGTATGDFWPVESCPVNKALLKMETIIMWLQRGMTLFLAIAMSILIVACSNTESNRNDYVFRAGDWGDSMETICKLDKQIDPIFPDFGGDIAWGKTVLNGCEAKFYYYFTDDKLTNGLYTFEPDFTNATSYIGLYEAVRESLSGEYGKPSYNEIRPIGKDSANENVENPIALENGRVMYVSVFETVKSDIVLLLKNDDNEIELQIFYTHVDYYDGKNGNSSN